MSGLQKVWSEEVLAPGWLHLRPDQLPVHLHALHLLRGLGRLGPTHLLLSLRRCIPVRMGEYADQPPRPYTRHDRLSK